MTTSISTNTDIEFTMSPAPDCGNPGPTCVEHSGFCD